MPNELLNIVDETMMDRSGAVFYSGRQAFLKPSKVYLLGLNPGGDCETAAYPTIAEDIEAARLRPGPWSSYADDAWEKGPGEMPMQRRVCHMFRILAAQDLVGDIRDVPASNVVLVRSTDEAAIKAEKADLLRACWPLHQAVIDRLEVRVVLCLGSTAGSWVREQMDAHAYAGSFTENNDRRWTSEAHSTADGRFVVTLTHPSRADWTAASADPTPLVSSILARCRN